jgi:hypothetical protein
MSAIKVPAPFVASLQAKMAVVPMWLRLTWGLGTAALALYWSMDQSGLARPLIDMQVSLLGGEYYVLLTVLLVWIVLLMPLFALAAILNDRAARRGITNKTQGLTDPAPDDVGGPSI